MALGAFVRLKLRLTANGLRGRPVRIVLFVLGVLAAGFFAVGGYAAFAVPGVVNSERAAAMLLPLGGAVLVLAWLFLPLIFFGVDESLDPARFALLPLHRRTLVAGLFTAALAGLPALSTLAATIGMVDTAAHLGGGRAAAAELLGVVLGLFLCVAVSRAVTSAFATALRSRRSRDLAGILLAVLAALLGPLQLALLAGVQRADWDTVGALARVIGWTPLGAPYSLGVDVAAGRGWQMPIKLVIVLATLVVLIRWWHATLESAMVGTVSAGGRRVPAANGTPVDLLLFRALPRTRFGALVSREARYWRRETRRRAGLITFSMAGVFLPVSFAISSGAPGTMNIFVGALAAMVLANQFGFDGSAYAANLTAGVPGRLEVQSRAVAHALYVLPVLAIIALLVGVLGVDPLRIPSAFGLLVAAYGVGLGLILPVSVRAAYALPDSSNPFALSAGGGPAKGLLAIGLLFGTIIVTLPLQIIALVMADVWRWIGLPIGIAYGAAAYLIGSTVAGDLLDKRAPELLAAVTPNR